MEEVKEVPDPILKSLDRKSLEITGSQKSGTGGTLISFITT